MKLFELIVDDLEDEIFAISLVETPAIESNFVFFDKEEVMFAKVEDEKRMVMGPVLIPDKKILRVDAQGQPYEVFFTKDTVADLARAYLKNKYTDSATLEHDEEKLNGVYLVESWIKTSKSDKSNDYGLNVPVGTWMGQFFIENEEIWDDYVKTGKVKGFSIEGLFTHLDRSYEKRLAAGKYTIEWEDLIGKEVDSFSNEEADVFLNKIKAVVNGAEPTVSQTYPGEVASGSIAPALLVEEGEIDVYGYDTSYFYICPGAIGTFKHLTEGMDIQDDDLQDMIRAAAVIADAVFMIEEKVVREGKSEQKDLRRAIKLVEMFKDVFETIDERTDMKHDIGYMDGHIEVIKNLL